MIVYESIYVRLPNGKVVRIPAGASVSVQDCLDPVPVVPVSTIVAKKQLRGKKPLSVRKTGNDWIIYV